MDYATANIYLNSHSGNKVLSADKQSSFLLFSFTKTNELHLLKNLI